MLLIVKAVILFVVVSVAVEVLTRATDNQKARQYWFLGIVSATAVILAFVN